MHQAFHVIALLAFLGAAGVAFVGFVGPLLFPASERTSLPGRKTAAALALAAAALTGADWAAHRLL